MLRLRIQNRTYIHILCVGTFLLFCCTQKDQEEKTTCLFPENGFGYSLDEIIDSSKVIILAQKKKLGKFEIINVIKGQAEDFKLPSNKNKIYSHAHFNLHEDKQFWTSHVGRSTFPVGSCMPSHDFKIGATYLFFPGFYGSSKSAELIIDQSDLWYQYVVKRVNNEIKSNTEKVKEKLAGKWSYSHTNVNNELNYKSLTFNGDSLEVELLDRKNICPFEIKYDVLYCDLFLVNRTYYEIDNDTLTLNPISFSLNTIIPSYEQKAFFYRKD